MSFDPWHPWHVTHSAPNVFEFGGITILVEYKSVLEIKINFKVKDKCVIDVVHVSLTYFCREFPCTSKLQQKIEVWPLRDSLS